MSNRLNQEREMTLLPKRMEFALAELKKLGFETINDKVVIEFIFHGSKVLFYPYSGWHTGKTIEDGRGWDHLMKQLIN